MIDNIINIHEVRQDLAISRSLKDFEIIDAEVDFLVDEASMRTDLALEEAKNALARLLRWRHEDER
jgi:hypothetical protein